MLAHCSEPENARRLQEEVPPRSISEDEQLRLLLVHAGDTVPEHAAGAGQQVLLDHRDLVLTTDEVQEVHPETVQDHGLLHGILHHSGGIPGFVAEADPADPTYEARLVEAARPWAERLFDDLFTQPLTGMSMWMGRIPQTSLRRVVGQVLGREVSEAEIAAHLNSANVTTTAEHHPGVPDALAAAVQQLAAHRVQDRLQEFRSRLIEVLMTPAPGMTSMTAIRTLSALHAWTELNVVLGERMHLLVHLNAEERRSFIGLWPNPVPQHLTHLVAAHEMLSRSGPDLRERIYFFGPGIPVHRLLRQSHLP